MGNLVKHVAIIMDGNRRWAKLNNLSYKESYKKAVSIVKELINTSIDNNIPYLTLFAFSTDNNKRNIEEINLLKSLINTYIEQEIDELLDSNIKFNIIGDYFKFDKDISLKLEKITHIPVKNVKLNLTIALNYSGKKDILQACNKILANYKDHFNTEVITPESFEKYLFTANLPDPDILIRTGGYKRLSNFLLWQISYTELFFLDVLWPEFKKEHFTHIINQFKSIERKYGK